METYIVLVIIILVCFGSFAVWYNWTASPKEYHMARCGCEVQMLETSITEEDIDIVLVGDLLNQLMATHFALRNIKRPFLGLYGACSTMAQSILLAAMLLDGVAVLQIK